MLLRPLPYADADRLVTLNHRDDRTGITGPYNALGDYLDFAAHQRSFDAFGAGAVGKTLVATALVSCWLPARRAVTVDPARTLTVE